MKSRLPNKELKLTKPGKPRSFAAQLQCSVDLGEFAAQTGGRMAQVLGVGGVFLKSSGPRRLARWYSRCLGFPLAGPTAAMFKPARMPKPSYTVWSVFSASSRYFRPSASQHMVNFVVDDVEGAIAQVVAAGGKAIGRVRDYPYGRFGWFLDPDGNKVELWQPVPVRRRGSAKRR